MEPQIRYVTSADGTRIAVSVLGEGRPLVHVQHIWFASMDSYWESPPVRNSFERLSQRRTLVRFDHRGIGLSDRNVSDLSLEARVSDLAAVVDFVGGDGVDVFASVTGGPVALAYTASNRQKVRRLILASAPARGVDVRRTARLRILWPLVQVDWEMFVRVQTLADVGWDEIGLRVGRSRLDSMTAEDFLSATRASTDYDVTALLPSITCPVLVMNQRGHPVVSLDITRALAASLPNARFVQYEQDQILMPGSDEMVRLMEQFLDEDRGATRIESGFPSGTAIILFADIADSTALTERLGDDAFRAKSRDLDSALRTIIREHAGTTIEGKTLGDGVLAVFQSARQAITCAATCHAAATDAGLALHVGIHAGDVIRESDPDGRGNVYGGAVNIAARVASASAAGETLVSQTVRDLARTSAGVSFEDRGEQALKGIDDPVRLFAVR